MYKSMQPVLRSISGRSKHLESNETFLGFLRQHVLLGSTLASRSQVIFNSKSSVTVIPPPLTVQKPLQLFLFTQPNLKEITRLKIHRENKAESVTSKK